MQIRALFYRHELLQGSVLSVIFLSRLTFIAQHLDVTAKRQSAIANNWVGKCWQSDVRVANLWMCTCMTRTTIGNVLQSEIWSQSSSAVEKGLAVKDSKDERTLLHHVFRWLRVPGEIYRARHSIICTVTMRPEAQIKVNLSKLLWCKQKSASPTSPLWSSNEEKRRNTRRFTATSSVLVRIVQKDRTVRLQVYEEVKHCILHSRTTVKYASMSFFWDNCRADSLCNDRPSSRLYLASVILCYGLAAKSHQMHDAYRIIQYCHCSSLASTLQQKPFASNLRPGSPEITATSITLGRDHDSCFAWLFLEVSLQFCFTGLFFAGVHAFWVRVHQVFLTRDVHFPWLQSTNSDTTSPDSSERMEQSLWCAYCVSNWGIVMQSARGRTVIRFAILPACGYKFLWM